MFWSIPAMVVHWQSIAENERGLDRKVTTAQPRVHEFYGISEKPTSKVRRKIRIYEASFLLAIKNAVMDPAMATMGNWLSESVERISATILADRWIIYEWFAERAIAKTARQPIQNPQTPSALWTGWVKKKTNWICPASLNGKWGFNWKENMKKLNAIKGHTYRPSRPKPNWEFKRSKSRKSKQVATATFIRPQATACTKIQGTQTLASMGLNFKDKFSQKLTNITGVWRQKLYNPATTTETIKGLYAYAVNAIS